MAFGNEVLEGLAGLNKGGLNTTFLGPAVNNELGGIETDKLEGAKGSE